MSKKNSLAKRKKHHAYLLQLEQDKLKEAAKRQVIRERVALRKTTGKKPKVEAVKAVLSNEMKKKKLLAKQLKSMTLGGNKEKKSGIHRKLSASSSDEEMQDTPAAEQKNTIEGDMDVDMNGGKLAKQTKGISKGRNRRATMVEWKKSQKRVKKSA